MKLSEINKEAVKSSLLVGVAYASITGGILASHDKPFVMWAGVAFIIGLLTGLFTTWNV